MENNKKKENMPVLIICAILFLVLWAIQRSLSAQENPTVLALIDQVNAIGKNNNINVAGIVGPLTGLAKSGNNSINGVIGQLQVMLTVIMVLTNRKKGFIVATALNLINALYIGIITILIKGSKNGIPGVFVALFAIVILAIIYFFTIRNDKMHEDLTKSYEQAIENNRIIKEKDEVLSYLAYYDRLTQMPNRHSFMENLEERVASGDDCTIIYIDLDNFKNINDTYGHSLGDELLVSYAKKLENLCGEDNFVGKIGGDEFGIILHSGMSQNDVINFVSSLQSIFGEPVNIRGDVFSITASYGAANFPTDSRSSDDLFRCAESAMFNAKANGKNQLCFYKKNA